MEMLIGIVMMSTMMWVLYSFFELTLTFVIHKLNWLFLSKLLCPKCFTFWVTLALTANPFLASLVAFNNYLIDKYITNTKINL